MQTELPLEPSPARTHDPIHPPRRLDLQRPAAPQQAVAVSPDDAHIAGARGDVYGSAVALYDATTTTRTYTNADPNLAVLPGTLAFSGNDLFGVARHQLTGELYLWRMQGVTSPESTLAMTAPSDAKVDEPLTIAGRLALPDGTAPGAQPLSVTRRLPDGATTRLPAVTTAEDGGFTVTDTSRIGGAIQYDVVWDGDSDYRWTTASVTVTVARRESALTLSGPKKGDVGKELEFRGALEVGGRGPVAGTKLEVLRTVSDATGTVTTRLRTLSLAPDRSFRFVDTPTSGGQYTYTVEFAGDYATLPTQVSHDVAVRDGQG
ncbi:hypothetical protein ACWEJ6_47515 [Nonomuraea sp. NPDC004702]